MSERFIDGASHLSVASAVTGELIATVDLNTGQSATQGDYVISVHFGEEVPLFKIEDNGDVFLKSALEAIENENTK